MSYIIEFLANTGSSSFELILVCCYIGLLAACVLSIYDKRVMGEFVRTLIRMDATSPEKAVTLSSAGYQKKSAIVRALRGNGMFKGLVYEASEAVEFDRENHAIPIYREKFNVESAKFYIPEPLKYKAQVRFEKKGTHIMMLVLGAILFGVLLVLALLFKDQILTLVNQYLDAMKGSSDSDYLYSFFHF